MDLYKGNVTTPKADEATYLANGPGGERSDSCVVCATLKDSVSMVDVMYDDESKLRKLVSCKVQLRRKHRWSVKREVLWSCQEQVEARIVRGEQK